MDGYHAGGCQCGRVRYRITNLMDNGHACFCRMCQKATGSLVAFWVSSPVSNLIWTRNLPEVFNSSDVAERSFCRDCGTTLTFRREGRPHLSISIASLDKPDAVELKFVWGVESRTEHFDMLDTVPSHKSDMDFITTEQAIATSHQHPDHET